MTVGMPRSSVAGPLAGVRVLDAGTMLAGPYGATLLGDLGADVIKIEPPKGDESRHVGPQREGERAAFLSLNRNKRDIVLDLTRPAARQVFGRLAETADVLITNIREPALSRLGLDYDQVRRHRPDILWAGVTAFGADGPYGGRPGIDFLAQGFGGLIALNGQPDGPFVRVTVPVVDVITSLLVASSVLAALHERTRSGRGQRIDVSLLDAVVHAQGSSIGSYLLTGEIPERTGNRSLYFAPSGIYPCADARMICITCPTEKFFRNLCKALSVSWADDPRFGSVELRLRHEDELDRELAQRCKGFSRNDLLERLVAADVPAAPVNEIPEVTRDPQIRHNGMIVETWHPVLGPLAVTGVPARLHGSPGSVRRGPPVLGQHTREILSELGYSSGQIGELASDESVKLSEATQE